MIDKRTSALMQKAYARWAPIYDVVYDKLLEAASKAVVARAVSTGRVILEAGIGTGLALEYYPRTVEIYGVDLSADMLKRAQEKVNRKRLTQVKALRQMDVCKMDFPDNMFDAVCAQFIITLVPQPERALNEFARVLKPGGRIILANHWGAPEGPVAKMEEVIEPLIAKIGWSSTFKTSRVEEWAEATGLFEVETLRPVFPSGFFKVMSLRKSVDAMELEAEEARAIA
ncbi:MAG: class I SAM-dependent methyltransferase [Methylobacteriaceae bacterium]|nr:class I SAM-dependent methyltransferase [Methylobacteriaceae bacterium]